MHCNGRDAPIPAVRRQAGNLSGLNPPKLSFKFSGAMAHHVPGLRGQRLTFPDSGSGTWMCHHDTESTEIPASSRADGFARVWVLFKFDPTSSRAPAERRSISTRFSTAPSQLNLPIEPSTRFELVVNLPTANALGLAIPPSSSAWLTRSSNKRRKISAQLARMVGL